MPYQEARDQYATARIFLWEKPLPVPAFRHQQMRNFYEGWELVKFQEAKSLGGLAWNTLGKAGAFWMFFLGPAFTLPLVFGWRLFGDRRIRPLVVIGGVCAAGLALNTWFYAHYAAPMTGLIYVLVLQGLRHVRAWRRDGSPVGIAIARAGPGDLPGDGIAAGVCAAAQFLYAAGLADDLVLHAARQCGASAHPGRNWRVNRAGTWPSCTTVRTTITSRNGSTIERPSMTRPSGLGP